MTEYCHLSPSLPPSSPRPLSVRDPTPSLRANAANTRPSLVTLLQDSTCRVYSLNPIENYKPVALTAHRDKVVGAYFAKGSLDIYSTSRDGTCLIWRSRMEVPKIPEKKAALGDAGEADTAAADPDTDGDGDGDAEMAGVGDGANSGSSSNDDDGDSDSSDSEEEEEEEEEEPAPLPRWSLSQEDRHYFLQDHAKVICSVLHKATSVLVVGFSNGVFGLYEVPDFNNIHTLSISNKRITAACINATGEWLGFGCAKAGQLLVWEWQSETYVLKQQGHSFDMNMVAYSPDGQLIATGGDDGKVKLWNTASGFCTVTFTEHVGSVTGLVFASSGMAVLSSSLDGTVRAYDLMRYRNFRTFTSPNPTQFSSLALDPSGELVCAGCVDTFEVCVWSMKTGKLLEMLSGHVGPVSGLVFNPSRALLASSSWDNTVRLWDVFEKKHTRDTLELGSDVVTLAFRPDGRELVSSSLNGNLTTWDVTGPAKQLATIEGRKDLQGGRKVSDRMTAKHSDASKCFTSVCYSSDGSCLLAGGNTKYVCIYELGQQVLLKRFCISENRSMDGTLAMLNSKDMTEAGPLALIDDDSDSDSEDRRDTYIPGTQKGDHSSRKAMPEVRTKAVQFSPTGRSWAAASTVGLLVYSLDDSMVFDPFDLDMDITPDSVRHAVSKREFTKALVMAFRLSEVDLEHEVVEAVPHVDVELVATSIPAVYLPKLLAVLAVKLEKSPHLEYYLQWSRHILNSHGRYLRENSAKFASVMRSLHRSLSRQHDGIGKLCEENRYALHFLASAAKLTATNAADEDGAAAMVVSARSGGGRALEE